LHTKGQIAYIQTQNTIIMAEKKPQSNSEKDFEQRLTWTRTALAIMEPQWANVDIDTLRAVVLVWDRVRAVGGDFSLKDADAIRAKVAATKEVSDGPGPYDLGIG